MKLCESSDFRDLISATREHFGHEGLTEQFIEKDYYVTEALRIVATDYPTQVVFKGGTSLSKGWGLIERFSEDIDLFLNRDAFDSRLSNQNVDDTLKAIEAAVNQHPGLTLDPTLGMSNRGVYRNCFYSYQQMHPGVAAIAPRILLEMGTRSGTYPTEDIALSSYVARFLIETSQSLSAEDEQPFTMKLLHFRRTFVEKLYAIHFKVMQLPNNGASIGAYARHYYDLYQLSQKNEVIEMLTSDEYRDIKQDCERISEEHFQTTDHSPEGVSFANSVALFPEGDLREALKRDYEQQCKNLCYRGNFPSWPEVEARFQELKEML